MRKRLKQLLVSKRGAAGTILSVFFALFLAMVISVCAVYIEGMVLINNVIKTAQVSLDTYVTHSSAAISSSIKSGHDYTKSLNSSAYESQLEEDLFLDDDLSCQYEDGKLRYQLSDIHLRFLKTDQLSVTATFQLNYPLYFADVKITEIDKPVTIESRYNIKV